LTPDADPSSVPALRSQAELAAEKKALARADEAKQIKEKFVPYTDEQLQALSQYYTGPQMEALLAAEEAITTEDLVEQWGPRVDQWKLEYMDDLSQVDPFADFKPEVEAGHAPRMRLRQERQWAPEELEWTARDEELAGMSEEQLRERFEEEYGEWEKSVGLDQADVKDPSMSEEDVKRLYSAMLSTPHPSLYHEALEVDSLGLVVDQVAATAIDQALQEAGKKHPSFVEALADESKNDPGFWERKYALASELVEEPGDDMTRDLSSKGPLQAEDIKIMTEEGLDQDFFNDHELTDKLAENTVFRGMGITDMLYRIEKSGLAEEVKASLRPLYTYKGTHREVYAKRILWPFVTEEKIWAPDPESHKTIKDLFETVQILKMDPIKKAELLAYSHWADTPKGDSLRPVLERAIATHEVDPIAEQKYNVQQLKKRMLGLDVLNEEFPLMVEGPNKDLFGSPMFDARNPQIPKIIDPRVRYPSTEEDAYTVGLHRVSQQTNFTVDELRRMRTKNLVFHRVVNQTRKGKIQSLYALTVAGNENGLMGIGEGKSFEPEDALLIARLRALQNIQPVTRYEQRTIYGTLNAKVGGTTVQLMSRPPGEFLPLFRWVDGY
jgi:Ribosomal protein S5, N-terminal domain